MNKLTLWGRRAWIANPESLEIALSIIAIVCGIYILFPFHIVSPPFQQLISIIPEEMFGLVFLAVGFINATAAFESYASNRRTHQVSAGAGMALWTFVSLATVLTNWRALALVCWVLFALLWLWVMLRDPEGGE